MTTSGGAKCWGLNSYGQLGDGSTTQRTAPVDVSGLSTGVSAIWCGRYYTCALTTAGGAKCWGANIDGQLGDGSTAQRTTPVDVSGLSYGVISLTLGDSHTCAVTTSGGVKCWGDNSSAQLGDGSWTGRSTAVNVVGLTSGVSMLVAGYAHTCSLMTSGGAKCWGDNSSSHLGDGSKTGHSTAVDVFGLTSGQSAIAVGNNFICTVTTSGGAKCRGRNDYGMVGDGSGSHQATAVDVAGLTSGVSSLGAGADHACALTTLGGAKCWGYNQYGRLGDGTTSLKLTAIDVSGLTSGVSSIAPGVYHTCAVVTSGGAKCWGRNDEGQLGDGSTSQRNTAVDVTGLTSGVSSLATGAYHTCAVMTSGGAKCWGQNGAGRLGDGSNTDRVTAVDVLGLTSGVSSIATGVFHTCALTTSGGAKCWGANSFRQLGDGSTTDRTTAVDVTGLTSGVSSIDTGYYHTCAMTTSGGVKCWGYNSNGQLGDGSAENRSTAVNVAGLTSGVSSLVVGHYTTCAVTTSGGVKCLGLNAYGQLGDDTPVIHNVLNGFKAQGLVTLSSSPLPGVLLRATDMGPNYFTQESTADGSGAYLLPIVEGVTFTITPELAGYTFAPPSITGTMAADITQFFEATLITYNISGTVTANSDPLAGASVDGGALGTATTNASGAYSFNTITPGTPYTLTVSHSGATFGVNTASGTLNSHATHDFSGTLNTYDITGTITDGSNPIVGVSVNGGSLGNTTTDGSGDYSFSGVNYGTVYTVTPSLTDYDFTPTSAGATLTGNATHDFTGVYDPPTTTSVSTTTVPTTSVAPSTTVETTSTSSIPSTSSLTTTSTAPTTSVSTTTVPTTSIATSTTIETTSTSSISSPSSLTTTSLEVSSTTVDSTTSAATSTTTIAVATTIPVLDSDGDGLTDAEEEALGTNPNKADSDDDSVTDSEEVTTGTNPTDAGSKSPKLRTTICSDWNGYLGGQSGRGMHNIMEHINLTTKKLRAKTELRSIRGYLKDTYEFFLRGNQQFDLLVHDLSGREVNSYGQVCTTYERAPAGSLDGRMVYYKFRSAGSGESGDGGSGDGGSGDGESVIEFAFALPFENPSIGASALLYNTIQPSLDQQDSGNLVANWVQLSNVSKKRLKGKLYFHKPDGSQIAKPVDVNLRDGARYDYSGHAYGANLAGLIRFVPTDKTVEYQLREVRYLYDNPGSEDSFASAYPFSAQVGSGEPLIASVDTTSSSAILELANPLAKRVNANIKLYDKTGKKQLYARTHVLNAYGSTRLTLDTYLVKAQGVLIIKGSLATGSGSSAGALLGNVVHYGRTASGGVKNMYVTPLREPIGTIVRGSYNTYLNQSCTLYLANIATAKETVSIGLKQSDGTSPISGYKLVVPSRGSLSENLCSKLPVNTYGVVTVTATHAKRTYATIVRTGDGERYKMATELR